MEAIRPEAVDAADQEPVFPDVPTGDVIVSDDDDPPTYTPRTRVIFEPEEEKPHRPVIETAMWKRIQEGGDLHPALATKVDRIKAARERFYKLQDEIQEIKQKDRDAFAELQTPGDSSSRSHFSMGAQRRSSFSASMPVLEPKALTSRRGSMDNGRRLLGMEDRMFQSSPRLFMADRKQVFEAPPPVNMFMSSSSQSVSQIYASAPMAAMSAVAVDSLLEGEIPQVEEDFVDLESVVLDVKHKAEDDELGLAGILEGFEEASRQQEMLVTQYSVAEIERRRLEVEASRINRLKKESGDFAKREVDLAWREQSARQRVITMRKTALKAEATERAGDAAQTRTRERGLRRQFARAQEHLSAIVAKQRASIRERFGFLELGDSVSARRYQVTWELIPRPIELRLHMVRAVKDKLPRGSYVFLVSMYDRLGGRVMRWTGEHSYSGGGIGNKFNASTKPVKHRGRFNDVSLKFDQSVFALCPSRPELRPGNCLVLELFRLADKRHARASVVAWTVLPICSPTFSVLQGRFKLPLLRGARNPNFRTFSSLEDKIGASLEHWVGNLYVEVRHLPRQVLDSSGALRDEHNVELDFINKLLRLPGSNQIQEEAVKKSAFETGKSRKVTPVDQVIDLTAVAKPISSPEKKLFKRGWWQRRDSIFDSHGARKRRTSISKHASQRDLELDDLRAGQLSEHDSSGDELKTRAAKSKICGAEVDGLPYDESMPSRRHADGSRFEPAGLGLSAVEARKTEEEDPDPTKTALKEAWWSDVSNPRELEEFRFAVREPAGHRTPLTASQIATTKLLFLWQELFEPLSSDTHSTTHVHHLALCTRMSRFGQRIRRLITSTAGDMSWYGLLIFAMTFWLRMYLHYCAQWMVLKANSVALYGFKAQVYRLEFKYQPDQLSTLEEVLIVAVGPFAVLASLVFLCLSAFAYQRIVGKMADICSQFLAAYGLATLLDPLLILVVDVLTSNYSCDTRAGCRQDYTKGSCHCFEGDAFKLWRRMVDENNGGIVGIFYCALVYTIIGVLTMGVCFLYLVELHMNGRILDTYRRINADDQDFFLPQDYEVSMPELEGIIAKAKQHKGELDQQRRVAVSNYIVKDPLVPSFAEVSTHVVIYEITLSGARAVHRHFVREPNGSIIEIFGDLTQHVGVEFAGLNLSQGGGEKKEGSILDALDHNPAQITRAGYFQGLRPLD